MRIQRRGQKRATVCEELYDCFVYVNFRLQPAPPMPISTTMVLKEINPRSETARGVKQWEFLELFGLTMSAFEDALR